MWTIQCVIASLLFGGLLGSPQTTSPSIIIIGSGPSGIAAATRLLKNNFTDLKILEAENRIGGRINSVKFGEAFVDLGAEYCHGEDDNIVYSMVKDLDLVKHSNADYFKFYQSNGEEIDKEIGLKMVTFADEVGANNKTKEGCEQVQSVKECLNIRIKPFINSAKNDKEKQIFLGFEDWATLYLCLYDSPLDLNDLKAVTDYKECGGDLYMNWNGLGYKTILDVMMQKYPNKQNQLPIDEKIFLQKLVINISNWQEGDEVTVTTLDGGTSTYKANHVIFTPSVGVLKATYKQLFNPPLPDEKVDAIKNIGFGAILKVILHFPDKWWEGQADWGFIWTATDKEELKQKNLEWLLGLHGLAQAVNNPKVLIGFYGGQYVPLIESLTEEAILQAHIYAINKFLAPHYNVSEPDKLIRTTWLSNPNFRGTYSYESVKGYSTGGKEFQKKLGSPLTNREGKPTILFAGEATHPYYFSTVHGAIESGYREADRLINFYNK